MFSKSNPKLFLSEVPHILTQTELNFDIKQTENSSASYTESTNVHKTDFLLCSGKTTFVTCKDSLKVQVAESTESDNKNRVFRQQK